MMSRDERQAAADERYMQLAMAEAMTAMEQDEIPVGAVVVCRGRVIARAHNLTETLGDVTAHAEMQAITSASNTLGGKYLTGCTIYVTLEPCAMCAGAIAWAQLSRLVYGAGDPKRGYTVTAPFVLHPKTTVTAGVCSADCLRMIQDFFREKR